MGRRAGRQGGQTEDRRTRKEQGGKTKEALHLTLHPSDGPRKGTTLWNVQVEIDCV